MEMKRSEHKENSKAWWEEKYLQTDGYLYSKAPSSFLFDHLDLLPKDAKILEIAAGEGRNAVALAAKGFQVTAIDWAPTALERAKTLASESGVSATFKGTDLDFYLPELLRTGA